MTAAQLAWLPSLLHCAPLAASLMPCLLLSPSAPEFERADSPQQPATVSFVPLLRCLFLSPPNSLASAGAEQYVDSLLHSPMSPMSVSKAYLSACLHITTVLGRESVLPKAVAAPVSGSGAAAITGAADAGVAAGDAASVAVDWSLLQDLKREQVQALRYLGISPRKGMDKSSSTSSGQPGPQQGEPACAATAGASAVTATSPPTGSSESTPSARVTPRLQLGVKRVDLLPRPRGDVLLVDCNPAAAAVFPGNTLLLPALEVIRDSWDGASTGGDGAGGGSFSSQDGDGLLGRGLAAVAHLLGAEERAGAPRSSSGSGSTSRGGPWLDVEASPEAGVRRMSLALAQQPPELPTVVVVSPGEAAAKAAAAAESARRIAIATGRGRDAAASTSGSAAATAPLDLERGDLELLADLVSLYRTAAAARLLTLRRARERQPDQQSQSAEAVALTAPGVSRVLSHAGSIESWLAYIKSRGIRADYHRASGTDAGLAGPQHNAFDPYLRAHGALLAVLRMKEAATVEQAADPATSTA